MHNQPNDNTDEQVKKALENGRNANDNFQEGEVDDYGADTSDEVIERDEIKGGAGQHGKERNRNDDFMDTKEFPDDESNVIFTDLQGIRRRGIYRKDQGFQEIAETEIPRKEQFFFPEDDIAQWEYEPESQSE